MTLSNDAKAFIEQRDEFIKGSAPMYYAANPGDIHQRERVINMSSAMLQYFGITNSIEDAAELSCTVIENQVSAEFDVCNLYEIENKKLRSEMLLVDKDWDLLVTPKQQRIYCSFHLGSYRLIVGYLLSKGINVGLLVTDDVIQKQIKRIYDFHQDIQSKEDFGNLEFFNAESFKGISEAVDFFQHGGSLLIYIDGNSGIGGMGRNDDRLLTVPFVNRNIKARKGVAFLSRALMTDIYPVYVRNNKDGSRTLITEQPIIPDKGIKKSEFIEATTRQLFNILGKEVLRDPQSWEGWLYIQKVTCSPEAEENLNGILPQCKPKDINPDELVFNSNEFTLLQYPSATVLMHIKQFKFQVLSASAIRAIRFVNEKQNVLHVVRKDLIEELINKKIILQGAPCEQ
jgi:KDO2-lipid IV(A) lauroyltransferase